MYAISSRERLHLGKIGPLAKSLEISLHLEYKYREPAVQSNVRETITKDPTAKFHPSIGDILRYYSTDDTFGIAGFCAI